MIELTEDSRHFLVTVNRFKAWLPTCACVTHPDEHTTRRMPDWHGFIPGKTPLRGHLFNLADAQRFEWYVIAGKYPSPRITLSPSVVGKGYTVPRVRKADPTPEQIAEIMAKYS